MSRCVTPSASAPGAQRPARTVSPPAYQLRAEGQERNHLARRINLRYTPELDFKYDETTMRASRIEALLVKHAPKAESESDAPIEHEDGEESSS